jgi:hypothetical protein
VAELEQIVNRGARVLGIGITPDGANEIARRARGTPRIAGRLLRRLRDFAAVAGAASIDRAVADKALAALEVDAAGLDAMDRRYLTTIAVSYGVGPVGVETLAAALRSRRPSRTSSSSISFNADCCSTPRGRLITSHASASRPAEPARDPAKFGNIGASEEECLSFVRIVRASQNRATLATTVTARPLVLPEADSADRSVEPRDASDGWSTCPVRDHHRRGVNVSAWINSKAIGAYPHALDAVIWSRRRAPTAAAPSPAISPLH